MLRRLRPAFGRRAVHLGRRPLLQLKLPIALLGLTLAFGALFVAHTMAAWGKLVVSGAPDPWVAQLAHEIARDYLTVSSAIAGGYVLSLVLLCLTFTHRLLGPIVALERHLERLRRGHYEARLRLRAGDPLSRVADELNELGLRLGDRTRTAIAEDRLGGAIDGVEAEDASRDGSNARAA